MQISPYTTGWCPSCRSAKLYLASRGVAWTEARIERTPGAAEIVMAEARGCRTVPTFIIEAEGARHVAVDWDRRKIDAVLDRLLHKEG